MRVYLPEDLRVVVDRIADILEIGPEEVVEFIVRDWDNSRQRINSDAFFNEPTDETKKPVR